MRLTARFADAVKTTFFLGGQTKIADLADTFKVDENVGNIDVPKVINSTRQVPSMIPSARLAVSPVANIIFCCFFARFIRTDNNDPHRP